MGDNLNPHSTAGFNIGGSGTVMKVTSISMMITAIFILVVIIFVLFLCLQAHYSLGARVTSRSSRFRRRSHAGPHFVFSAGDNLHGSGLDPAVLASLPVTIYRSSEFDHKQAFECAICLAEIADGEKARLLPRCNHGFHLECIDTWFRSNSTCPICRGFVDGEEGRDLTEPQDMGGERSDPRGERMLDVSIQSPRSPLPSSRFELEEMKAPIDEGRSPETSEVEFFRRIMSGESGACCSIARVGDIEEGLMGSGEEDGEGTSVVLKTPIGVEDAAVD